MCELMLFYSGQNAKGFIYTHIKAFQDHLNDIQLTYDNWS